MNPRTGLPFVRLSSLAEACAGVKDRAGSSFWSKKKLEDEESGEERNVPILRLYNVFNVAQCDSLKDPPASGETTEPVPVTKAPKIVAGMPNCPKIKHGMTQSCYSPNEDCISMPLRKRFGKEEEYYFHPLSRTRSFHRP